MSLPSSLPSSPESHTTGAAARELKASKDRNCPFCGQAFTSSSLGRHLDLYIKPRNPKPPDGVHDVDEIRRIRGGITRRQPRTSSKGGHGREGSEVSVHAEREREKDEGEKRRFTDREVVHSPTKEGGSVRSFFNAPIWQATGVINDLPARSNDGMGAEAATTMKSGFGGSSQAQRVHDMRHDAAGNKIERPEYGSEDIWRLQESAEVGKAAEMALREVMGSLEAAKKKAEPKEVYEDFDFMALSFPALCLAILPPPPTLFSSTPFEAPHTWSLAPPGERQFEALKRMVNERMTWVRNGKVDNLPDAQVFKYHVHLEASYEHWQSLAEGERAAAWNLEICRAFVGEKGKRQDVKRDLELAQQRVQHLEAEYDRLSRCQLPREYLLNPPKTLPVSATVMREMRNTDAKSTAASVNYNAEVLLEKWRDVVKSTARPARSSATMSGSSVYHHTPRHVETWRNPIKDSFIMNGAVVGVGGPMPRNMMSGVTTTTDQYHQQPHAVEEADAEEEVDEVVTGQQQEDPPEERRALTRLRSHDRAQQGLNGLVNSNGKRPVVGGGAEEMQGRAKLFREQIRS